MGLFKAIFNLKENSNRLNGQAQFQSIISNLPKTVIIPNGSFHKRNFWRGKAKDFKCTNLTKKLSPKQISSFVAFDVETTGIPLTGNDVIEISAVRFYNFQPIELLTTLIKPQKPIPREATAINNITDNMVKNSPSFYQIIPAFERFIGDLPLVAHNAEFDVSHLYVNGLDSIINKIVFDSCSISRKLNKTLPDHKLATACSKYNIYFNGAHRASADALACGMLFVQEILQFYSYNSIQELLEKAK